MTTDQTETPAEKVRRIIATRAGQQPVEATLPSREDVGIVTLTLDELHDLVYAAACQANRTSTLTLDRARRLARVAAERSRSLAVAHDGYTVGRDPRG